jgi:hypothetical protein
MEDGDANKPEDKRQKTANSDLGTSTPSSRHFIDVKTCKSPSENCSITLFLSFVFEVNFRAIIE